MAAATSPPRILLHGAAGFIGGSILAQLLESTAPSIRAAPITCVVRGADRIAKLKEVYGDQVNPVLYKDHNDFEVMTELAEQHDVVISATLGALDGPALAFQEGLARRKRAAAESGGVKTEPWLIHTSGASNVGSRPITGAWMDTDTPTGGGKFDDAADDIYGYETDRNVKDRYMQRTAELNIINGGLERDVRTLVVMPPLIYGIGTGLFNKYSVQILGFMSISIDRGQAIVIGNGEPEWDYVHVRDLASLYELITIRALEGAGRGEQAGTEEGGLPWGKKGIMFASNGRFSWMDLASRAGRACHDKGLLPNAEVEQIGLTEATRLFADHYPGRPDESMIEVGFAGAYHTVATVAREHLGWNPVYGEDDWAQGFADDLEAVMERRGLKKSGDEV